MPPRRNLKGKGKGKFGKDKKDKGQRALFMSVRAVALGVLKVYTRITYEGLENVPLSGGYIVAPVHRSNVDFVTVPGITRRRIRYLGKETLWKYSFLHGLWDALGGIKVVRGTTDRESMRLCNDTLRYGRAEEQAPLRQTLALHELAADVGDGLDLPRLVDGRTTLEWSIAIPPSLTVKADPEQLFRILNNLVRNAVQAIETQALANSTPTDATGRISITATRNGGGVTITVSDNGPGVPEKAKANLFKAFQTSNRVGGSGLGLAIAAELVAAHGGHLKLVDSPSGVGATFAFDLPDDLA